MKFGPILVALSASGATGFRISSQDEVPSFTNEEPERVAWNDCGGKGASASMKIRSLAARLGGASGDDMPREWVRNAGQDCMETSEDGDHKPFPGHNGFDPPAVVHNRVCASYEADECQGDDNCEMNGDKCTYSQTAHEFSHEHVFPKDRGLYADTELALGTAEEVTHAGIAELTAEGTHAGMDKVRAKQHFEDFQSDEAKQSGDTADDSSDASSL